MNSLNTLFFALPKLPSTPGPDQPNSRALDRAPPRPRSDLAAHPLLPAVASSRLENRFGLLGPTRVQIPPPPLHP